MRAASLDWSKQAITPTTETGCGQHSNNFVSFGLVILIEVVLRDLEFAWLVGKAEFQFQPGFRSFREIPVS